VISHSDALSRVIEITARLIEPVSVSVHRPIIA
jgi:hypothetical protein